MTSLLFMNTKNISTYKNLGPLDLLLHAVGTGDVCIIKSSLAGTNGLIVSIPLETYRFFLLALRYELKFLYFIQGLTIKDKMLVLVASCFCTSHRVTVVSSILKYVYSGSNTFGSLAWVEREIAESEDVFFIGLLDSRRLLTNYVTQPDVTSLYRTDSYDTLTQNIYKELLHWSFQTGLTILWILLILAILIALYIMDPGFRKECNRVYDFFFRGKP